MGRASIMVKIPRLIGIILVKRTIMRHHLMATRVFGVCAAATLVLVRFAI